MTTRNLLDARLSRRGAVATVAIAAGAIGLRQTSNAQGTTFASGGLGLTKAEIEDQWGAGELVEVPGHAIYDETYQYAGQGWTYTVWFVGINGEEVAGYVEVAFGADGVAPVEAREMTERLLPGDAEFSELFVAPATPQGPTALVTTRYLSESLGATRPGIPPEILVTQHEAWDAAAPEEERVTAIGLMIRLVTQRG